MLFFSIHLGIFMASTNQVVVLKKAKIGRKNVAAIAFISNPIQTLSNLRQYRITPSAPLLLLLNKPLPPKD